MPHRHNSAHLPPWQVTCLCHPALTTITQKTIGVTARAANKAANAITTQGLARTLHAQRRICFQQHSAHSAQTGFRRQVKRRLAGLVGGVDLGAVLHQLENALQVALSAGVVQRSVACRRCTASNAYDEVVL